MNRLRAVAALAATVTLVTSPAGADGTLTVLGVMDERAPSFSVSPTPGGALVAGGTGTSLVDVSHPGEPVEIAFVPGGPATSRDAIWHQGYVYAVAGAGGGLQVIDWSDPGAPWIVDEITTWFETARGLVHDPVLNRLLVFGSPTGLHALSIVNPIAPTAVWTEPFSTFEALDVAPLGGLALLATGVSVALVNVASTPDLLAWITYPGVTARALAHADDDGLVLVADAGSVSLLSARTLSNIRHLATHAPGDPGVAPVALAHRDGRLAIAWSPSQVEVVDTSDPTRPERVAHATVGSTLNDVAFSESDGVLLACDAALGLVTLSLDDRWAEFSGTVENENTGEPCPDASVRDADSGRATTTSSDGGYRLRVPPGSRSIVVEKFGFETTNLLVDADPGEVETVDHTLRPVPTGDVRGAIALPGPEPHPEGTIVRLLDTPIVFPAQLSGDYFLPNVPAGEYLAEVDAMGSATSQTSIIVRGGATTRRDFFLSPSVYTDTFEIDSGWLVGDADDDATTGIWTRAIPVGTAAGYVQPLVDETPAPGTMAFVTGNGASGEWFDLADVDGGQTTLTSPVIDLTGVTEPILRYYRWLALDARWDDETPDSDRFEAWVSSDGGDSWNLIEERAHSDHRWSQIDYWLSDYTEVTDAMRFRFIVSDRGEPSIVEAAIDDVEIFTGSGLERPPDYTAIQPGGAAGPPLAPPPLTFVQVIATGTQLEIRYRLAAAARAVTIRLYDVSGRQRRARTGPAGPGVHHVLWPVDGSGGWRLPSGHYFLELSADEHRVARPVVVLH